MRAGEYKIPDMWLSIGFAATQRYLRFKVIITRLVIATQKCNKFEKHHNSFTLL